MNVILITIVIVLFIITWIAISTKKDEYRLPDLYQSDLVVRLQAENNKLFMENKYLREDIQRLTTHPYICYRTCKPCCKCEPKYYQKTPDRQEIMDLIKSTSSNLKSVQEKLLEEFKIN